MSSLGDSTRAALESGVVTSSGGWRLDETPLGSVIRWQDAPIGEVGVTGDQPETLLPLLISRMRVLNQQPHGSRETSLAITHCEEALHWLQARRAEREQRGVEGTQQA